MKTLRLAFLDLNPTKDDIIKISFVVKGSDADLAPGKGLVDRRLHWFLHIVEVNVDFSGFDIPYDFEVMKLAILPRNSLLGENKVFPGGLVHDEYLARVWVRLLAEVEVVKVGRILIIEEEAKVTVPSGCLCGLDPGSKNEGAHDLVFEESNAVGAAKGGPIFGNSEKLEDLVAIDGSQFPFSVVSGLPCAGILGEVFLVDHWEFFFGLDGKGAQDG